MRLCSLALSFYVVGLVGCAAEDARTTAAPVPEEFQHCTLQQSDGWRITEPPADIAAILAIPVDRGTIDSELGHAAKAEASHEHWFMKDESHLAVCRHLDVPDSCHSDATMARVKKVDGQWLADGPVLESICLAHERIR
jgi:hypothetical protein